MSYSVKLTAVGLAKLAAASVGGPPVQLTQMAVGDGNGNPVTPPTGAETTLVRQVYSAQINALYVSPSDASQLIAEFVIPSSVGGWAVHEIGILDSSGALFAYGNFPATWKPVAADGSTRDMIVRAALKVSNQSLINLVIDTSIVVATRQWVLATITGAYLIPGGNTGQVLKKVSNAAGDYAWFDATAAINIVVDVIKEEQTATAGQTTFTLAVCTTDGVAVYVEGMRVHSFIILNSTQVQLPSSLPSGSKVLFVQNEPNEPLYIRRLISGRTYFMGQL